MQSQLSAVEDKLHEQARLVENKAAEARTDVLTGLANRRAFDDKVTACCAEFERSHRPFSLILGDIDHFKKFNDTHGHQTGDEVLRGTARVFARRPATATLSPATAARRWRSCCPARKPKRRSAAEDAPAGAVEIEAAFPSSHRTAN